MYTVKLITLSICSLLCADCSLSQEEVEALGDKIVTKTFKLHPVECGSGKVQVKIEFENPLRESVTIYTYRTRAGRVRFNNQIVKDSETFTFEIEVPSSQMNLDASAAIGGWPTDQELPKGGKYLSLGEYKFILPVVSLCDVVDTDRNSEEFDFYLINRSRADWRDVQVESSTSGVTFSVELIKELPRNVRDLFPELSREFYGVRIVPRSHAKDQIAVRVYSRLQSEVEAYQLVGEETLVYQRPLQPVRRPGSEDTSR